MNRRFAPLILLSPCLLVLGCTSITPEERVNRQKIALEKLTQQSTEKPANYRSQMILQKDQLITTYMATANRAMAADDLQNALVLYQQVLSIDPTYRPAELSIQRARLIQQLLPVLQTAKQAYEQQRYSVALTLTQDLQRQLPHYVPINQLLQQIEYAINQQQLNPPELSEKLRRPISLELKDAPVSGVLDLLSQTGNINFIVDHATAIEQLKTTIYAKNTSIQEALNMIMQTTGLRYKIMNANTFLIYDQKRSATYDELITRSFYLNAGDVMRAQEMLRSLYAPKAMFYDERLRLLIIRDTKDVVDSADRLLQGFDLPTPEVVLDIEVLEVNRDKLLGLGIDFPNQIGVRALNPAGVAGSYSLDQLRALNSDSLRLIAADPIATLNFKQTSTQANLLANPKIRVKSKETANFLIGDKVPVVTTTTNPTSGSITESVNYLDVGLKVDVKPEVRRNNEVNIEIKLEVSNLAREVRSSTGLVAYQIGTRSANTTLQLRDGETQMLAGLIRDDRQQSGIHLPGIGKIPLLGRLFSNTTETNAKSEIVLLVTPRIVRPYAIPPAHVQAYNSGTVDQVSLTPLRLSEQAVYQAQPLPLSQPQDTTALVSATTVTTKPSVSTDTNAVASSSNTTATPTLMNAAASTPVRFQLNGPSQLLPNQAFSLVLLQNQLAYHQFGLTVEMPEGVEFEQAVATAPQTSVQHNVLDRQVLLTINRDSQAYDGALLLLNFKTSPSAATPTAGEIRLSQAWIKPTEFAEQQAVSLDIRHAINIQP